MGEIYRVQAPNPAQMGRLPDARVGRQEDPRKHQEPPPEHAKPEDILEIGAEVEPTPEPVQVDLELEEGAHLDLTA